jgi:hypothetical protein
MATPESLALLQQMLSPTPADRDAAAQALEAHEDPRVRLIAQYVNQQPAPAETDGEVEAPPGPIAASPVSDPARIERARRARHKLRRLIDELDLAQTIGDTLAAALGACYLCWGEDERCEECRGAGRPGWALPDAELYERLVVPARRRFDRECAAPGITENGRDDHERV